jgi:cell division protein FtsI (penicillin-binding protein 3)
VFEPGSTFKIVTAVAALEEGVSHPNDLFDCEKGEWRYKTVTVNDHEPEGVLTFFRMMEVSSNIGLAKVGLRLGNQKFYDWIRSFGFGSRTGSEIPGESAGLLRAPSEWSGVSLPILSFGQEVGVTALQLACAYSALANGGTLWEPRFVQSIRTSSGSERTRASRVKVRRVMTPETAKIVGEMLEGVVLRGTGQEARLEGWSVAGKTGTAQKIDPKLKTYSPDKNVASFCGYAPAKNPRLTIVVILNEPQGITWGGYNAGPVFKNIAWHSLIHMGVPSDL